MVCPHVVMSLGSSHSVSRHTGQSSIIAADAAGKATGAVAAGTPTDSAGAGKTPTGSAGAGKTPTGSSGAATGRGTPAGSSGAGTSPAAAAAGTCMRAMTNPIGKFVVLEVYTHNYTNA